MRALTDRMEILKIRLTGGERGEGRRGGAGPDRPLPSPTQRLGETHGSIVSGKYLHKYGVPLAMWIRARLGIGQKVFESHRIHNFFFFLNKLPIYIGILVYIAEYALMKMNVQSLIG